MCAVDESYAPAGFLKVSLWLLTGLIKLIEMVVRSLMVGLDIAAALVVFGIEKCFVCSRKSNRSAFVPAHSYAYSAKAGEVLPLKATNSYAGYAMPTTSANSRVMVVA